MDEIQCGTQHDTLDTGTSTRRELVGGRVERTSGTTLRSPAAGWECFISNIACTTSARLGRIRRWRRFIRRCRGCKVKVSLSPGELSELSRFYKSKNRAAMVQASRPRKRRRCGGQPASRALALWPAGCGRARRRPRRCPTSGQFEDGVWEEEGVLPRGWRIHRQAPAAFCIVLPISGACQRQ
jgi:hypothetical protein